MEMVVYSRSSGVVRVNGKWRRTDGNDDDMMDMIWLERSRPSAERKTTWHGNVIIFIEIKINHQKKNTQKIKLEKKNEFIYRLRIVSVHCDIITNRKTTTSTILHPFDVLSIHPSIIPKHIKHKQGMNAFLIKIP